MNSSRERKAKVELLAPGGSYDGMRAAIAAGADAVYMGGTRFGARAFADNPQDDELIRAIEHCHIHGRRLYLTVNTLLKEAELTAMLYDFLEPLVRHGLDAVLVQDLGVLSFLRKEFPSLELHASTQMSVQSADGALFLKERGVHRIVPARELSLEEIRKIYDASKMEIECFVHGALCYSYSGQCLLSSMIGGRSGNRGRCAQPCRQVYSLTDEYSGKVLCRDKYLLSLKDICMLEHIPEMIGAGVCSFKIEGRMKRPEYAAGVTEIYRKYLDLWLSGEAETITPDPKDLTALKDLYNRGGFSHGYVHQKNGRDMMSMDRPNHAGTEAARVIGGKNGKGSSAGTRLVALEDLYPGDLLETEPVPGQKTKGFTLEAAVSENEIFTLPGVSNLKKGQAAVRMRSQQQLDRLRSLYLDREIKENIKGMFILQKDVPAILTVQCRGETVEQSGPVPQMALTRQTTKEDVLRQLQKTGQTPFAFETLELQVEEGLFFPLQALNEMRRNALDRLRELLLKQTQIDSRGIGQDIEQDNGQEIRQDVGQGIGQNISPDSGKCIGSFRTEGPGLSCLIMSGEQLAEVILHPGIKRIYLDSAMWLDEIAGRGEYADHEKIKEQARAVKEQVRAVKQEAKAECMLALPVIWRSYAQDAFYRLFTEEILDLFDGYLLRHTDQIRAFAPPAKGKLLVADDGIYVFSHAAFEALRREGIAQITFPAELNAGELKGLKDLHGELTAYGRTIVMRSAQCLRKNTSGCSSSPGWMSLTDRTGAAFPVINHCGICTNVIYNSRPTSLLGEMKRIRSIGPDLLRLSFTTEDAGETAAVLDSFAQMLSGTGEDHPLSQMYTRGHFLRGVD